MKLQNQLWIFLLLMSFFSCGNHENQAAMEQSGKSEKTVVTTEKRLKRKTTSTKKQNQLISPSNVVPFLTEYGKKNPETLVEIQTRLGNIRIRLYKKTPLHRANFIYLAKNGYFDTTCFYRVVPGFIIQGGNSENLTTIRYRNKYKNYKLPPEFVPEYKHKYGALAAARDWENNPNKLSTPFEFYIVEDKKGAHHLDGEHTVFGEVISGFSVVDKIAHLEAGGDEWPIEDVFMTVKVLK